MDHKLLILLDLNYTLVESSERTMRMPDKEAMIEQETYRQWLVELIRPHHVALVTVRPVSLARATLDHIHKLCNWSPIEHAFNDMGMTAPEWKEHVWTTRFLPALDGMQVTSILAIESNPRTRAMYTKHGVRSVRVTDMEIIKG